MSKRKTILSTASTLTTTVLLSLTTVTAATIIKTSFSSKVLAFSRFRPNRCNLNLKVFQNSSWKGHLTGNDPHNLQLRLFRSTLVGETTNSNREGSMGMSKFTNEASNHGLVDIGVNLLDPMYSGTYRGKDRHKPDMHQILHRASLQNVQKLIVTAGTLEESAKAFDLVQQLRETHPQELETNNSNIQNMQFYSSVGVHPTRCQQEFAFNDEISSPDKEQKLVCDKIQELRTLIQKGLSSKPSTVVALGELGLDYARTEFCSIEHQKRGLLAQLELALEFPELPLFVHNRETGTDLYELLRDNYCKKKKDFRIG